METETLRGSGRYLSFPFKITTFGGAQSGRSEHIRQQIAQVLLTGPGERVFVKDFGLGVSKLLFAPMTNELWSRIESALAVGVADALQGEAEQGSIEVSVGPDELAPEQLNISIRYRLAAINRNEELLFTISNGVVSPPGSALEGA